jgi:hypothetical protein
MGIFKQVDMTKNFYFRYVVWPVLSVQVTVGARAVLIKVSRP